MDGEEIDLFLEDPLIVGEITSKVDSIDKVRKFLRKVEVVRRKYGREPRKLLIVLVATSEVAGEIRRIAREEGIELMLGRIK